MEDGNGVKTTSWEMPEKTDWAKQQNAHEPTRAYGEDIFNAVRAWGAGDGKYVKILEIGAAWGVSTLAILTALREEQVEIYNLTSVDPDPTIKASQEVAANGFLDNWILAQETSAEFWSKNNKKFDLIFIDGSHLYEDVKMDLTQAWRSLKPGGKLIIDDYLHIKNIVADVNGKRVEYGVSYACWEFIHTEGIEQIYTGARLLILG